MLVTSKAPQPPEDAAEDGLEAQNYNAVALINKLSETGLQNFFGQLVKENIAPSISSKSTCTSLDVAKADTTQRRALQPLKTIPARSH